MQAPAKPDNELKRLETLRSLNILDTLAEERFDRLTRLARRIFDVPIALVSLVDEDRQWFKSCLGLSAKETPREISFCGHAILQNDVFVVEDTYLDSRFHDNPLVTGDPNIRFYAGCPINYLHGYNLGTLCLLDTKPRQFDADDQQTLKELTELVESEITAIELATMDTLTGVSNRRGLMNLATHALGFCKRHDLRAALVYLDLNEFKSINDKYGHAEGDKVLVTFADILQHACRSSDIVARLGGDEFIVMLTDASKDKVDTVLNRFARLLEQHNDHSQQGYSITFSYGVVEYDPAKHDTLDDLLAAGDEMMYERKRNKKRSKN